MYKHVVNLLISDILYLGINNNINEIDSIESVLFPNDMGMFDYNKSDNISLSERFLLFHNE